MTVLGEDGVEQSSRPAILVVEDDQLMAWMLTKALERLTPGYPIQHCRDGLDALAYLMQQPVACVITDYTMPTMDGITLGEIMADTWPAIPVLLMSAQAPGLVRRQLKEQPTNFITILEKPFDLTDLQAALAPLLMRHAPSDAKRQIAG